MPAPVTITSWSLTLPLTTTLPAPGILATSLLAFKSASFTLDAPLIFRSNSSLLSAPTSISQAPDISIELRFLATIVKWISREERNSRPALMRSIQSRPRSIISLPSTTSVVMRFINCSSASTVRDCSFPWLMVTLPQPFIAIRLKSSTFRTSLRIFVISSPRFF